jgi:hypothetical protein
MTARDQEIIEFLSKCPSSSGTINKIFFHGKSMRMTNKRLKFLYDYGHLKRIRETTWDNYFYYVQRKPVQLQHYDYIARAYFWILKQGYEVIGFDVQKQYGNIRPDLLADIRKDGRSGLLPVEIELNLYNLDHKVKLYESSGFEKLVLFSNRIKESKAIKIINRNIKELQEI